MIACFGIVVTGCAKKEELSSYTIKVDYFDDTHTANCSMEVNYLNKSDNALSEIKFHLHPNAFSAGEEERVSTPATRDKIYPNSVSYGGIEIGKTCVNFKEVDASVSDDKMFLS